MAEEQKRKYDIVVFGATGFTGQYVVDEVARVAEEENLTWAISGRSMAKLQKVLKESSERIGKNVEETAILIADTSSSKSLLELAQQSKLILNCVGPYRFYGEQVVQACIEGGAHHLDISGEPQFLEKMQLLYDGKAKDAGIFVVGATGFDSIPAEMGLLFTERHFKDGRMSNVESYFKTYSGPSGGAINTGTLESALHGVANYGELGPLRKQLYPEPMPKLDYKLPKRSMVFYSKEVNKWCLPFLGSDKSVVYRTTRDLLATQRLEKPIEFVPYLCLSGFFQVVMTMLFGAVFMFLSKFSFGRSLMMKYPHIISFGVFKKGGPTPEQIAGTSFSMTFIAQGYKDDSKDEEKKKPDMFVTTKLVGPEPGYVTTPICMVQCAICILKEKNKLFHKSGVLTAGAAFRESTLIERLEQKNMKFETISDSSKENKEKE